MRVAIDLTALADHLSGIERYAGNVARQLVLLDADDDFVLLFKGAVHPSLAALGERDNVEVRVVTRAHGGKAVFSQLALPRELRRLHPDVALFLAFPCPVLYRGTAVSAIHDLCCYDCPDTMTWHSRVLWRVLDGCAARRGGRLVTVSEFSRGRIVGRYGMEAARVTVVPCGVDRGRFDPGFGAGREAEVRERYGLPGRFVLSLSTIEPRKRLDLLVAAWSELWDAGATDRDLVLAGRCGWKVDRLLDGISPAAREHVRLTGFVADDDLPVLYRMGDPFVFPSRYEGFGLPPVEAHDSGARVLCSDIPSLREVCGDRVAYFRSGDKDDLKRALVDAGRFDGMSGEPLDYSWEASARRLAEVVGSLRGGPAPATTTKTIGGHHEC